MSGAQSALINFEMSGAHALFRFWECTHYEWCLKEHGALELVEYAPM